MGVMKIHQHAPAMDEANVLMLIGTSTQQYGALDSGRFVALDTFVI